jgi:integrase
VAATLPVTVHDTRHTCATLLAALKVLYGTEKGHFP